LEEEVTGLESTVLLHFLKCYNQGKESVVSVQTVTNSINLELPEREQLSTKKVGRILTGLGFEKTYVGKGGMAAYRYSQQLIDRLKRDPRYELAFHLSEETTNPPPHTQKPQTSVETPVRGASYVLSRPQNS